jgi:hypothetical protein
MSGIKPFHLFQSCPVHARGEENVLPDVKWKDDGVWIGCFFFAESNITGQGETQKHEICQGRMNCVSRTLEERLTRLNQNL